MEHCAPCKQFVQKAYAFHNKALKNMLKIIGIVTNAKCLYLYKS